MAKVVQRMAKGILEDVELVTCIFLILDLLIYFDRGILPGMHEEVVANMPESPELYYGLLQSTFVSGLAGSAPLLAYLSIRHQELLVFITIGLVCWNLSIFGCSLTSHMKTFSALMMFRGFTGIGEAAFSTLVVPAMVDCQPPERKGLFLGLFYALMPVGVSLGFIVSSAIPEYLGMSYDAAFGFLGCAALPYVLIVALISYVKEARGLSPWLHPSLATTELLDDAASTCRAETAALRSAEKTPLPKLPFAHDDLEINSSSVENRIHSSVQIRKPLGVHTPEVFYEQTATQAASRQQFDSGLLVALLLAGSAHAAVNASLASFGASFLLDLQVFKTEFSAASTVGGVAVSVGAVGTFVGGLITQRSLNKICAENRREVSRICARVIFTFGALGSLIAMTAPALLFYDLSTVALITLSAGIFLICMCQAPLNMGVMACCRRSKRSLALSVYTLGIHLLGDVPGPILIGLLKDRAKSVCGDLTKDCLDWQRANLKTLFAFLILWTVPIWIGGAMALANTRQPF